MTWTLTARIIDIAQRRIEPVTLTVDAGRIAAISPAPGITAAPGSDVDTTSFILPGFVDAHVHVESSMLTPAHFAAAAVRHGTVATVSDPHEIANVLGLAGVRYMLDNASASPFKFAFGAPSCVPATTFETAGATLSVDDVTALLDDDRIYYLSEVMNFPGVLADDPSLLAMIRAAHDRHKPVDGHAPGLRNPAAADYFAHGIHTDHECFTLEEALDKLAAGVTILIREGSAARNFDALYPLLDSHPGRVMLCSDDKHPDELMHSHIDALVRRALAQGCDFFNVLRAACVVPVEHYRLSVGQLRVGDPADFIEIDSLENFRVLRTFLDGHCVAENGVSRLSPPRAKAMNHFVATPVQAEDFALPAEGHATLRVIQATDGQLVTAQALMPARIELGLAVTDVSRDLLKLAVVNRYTKETNRPAVCFITGFGLQRGAIAGSVAHDSHNILVVGVDDDAMARAVNAVIAAEGGLSAVDGQRIETLPLPVAGLMSQDSCATVATGYETLDRMAREMGSPLRAPYMTLSFMALLVIPALKLSDRGLFDGNTFSFTSNFAD